MRSTSSARRTESRLCGEPGLILPDDAAHNQNGDGQTVRERSGLIEPFGAAIQGVTDRQLALRDELYQAGDKRRFVYQVLQGVMIEFYKLSDGRQQVLAIKAPGDFLAMTHERVHPVAARAASRARVRCVSLGLIQRRLAEDHAFGIAMQQAACIELQATRRHCQLLRIPSALQRLAAWLLEFVMHETPWVEDPLFVRIPLVRTEIADYLGLNNETISRSFTALRKAGIIELRAFSQMRVLDTARLAGLAASATPVVSSPL